MKEQKEKRALSARVAGLLAEEAIKARENAYAPYSGFCVGAALLTEDGEIYRGCNIENAAFSPSCCAERTAVFSAVSQGKRKFRAIAVAGWKEGEETGAFCPPCGVCRQVLAEFASPQMRVILVKSRKEYKIFTLGELLPESFSL